MSMGPLLALTEADPWLAAPSRCHRDLPGIAAATRQWAHRVGLAEAETDYTGFAGRSFPETRVPRVALFAQWLTWVFHFDDELDEGPLGKNAEDVSQIYEQLLDTVRKSTPHHDPLLLAFADLWNATVPGMSPAWLERFGSNFTLYARGIIQEADNRHEARIPSPDEYPRLRRWIAGPFMYDLMEPILGVEVPQRITRTQTWKTLVNGAIDVIAWSNDIASRDKEIAHGDVTNYVIVVAHHMGMSTADSSAFVMARIQDRLDDMHEAARQLPALLRTLPPSEARDTSKVACGFIGAPRGHLDWLIESPRYKS